MWKSQQGMKSKGHVYFDSGTGATETRSTTLPGEGLLPGGGSRYAKLLRPSCRRAAAWWRHRARQKRREMKRGLRKLLRSGGNGEGEKREWNGRRGGGSWQGRREDFVPRHDTA